MFSKPKLAATLVAAALILAPSPLWADGQPVAIELLSGERIEGELLGFGSRTYQVRTEKGVVELDEAEIARLIFLTPDDRATLDGFPLEGLVPPEGLLSVPLEENGPPAARLQGQPGDKGFIEQLLSQMPHQEALTDNVDLGAVTGLYVAWFSYAERDGIVPPHQRSLFGDSGRDLVVVALRFERPDAADRYLQEVETNLLVEPMEGHIEATSNPPLYHFQARRSLMDRLVVLRRGPVVAMVMSERLHYVDHGLLARLVDWTRDKVELEPLGLEERLPRAEDWEAPANAASLRRAAALGRQLTFSADPTRMPSLAAQLQVRVPVELDSHTIVFAPLGEARPVATVEVLERLMDAHAAAHTAEVRTRVGGGVASLGPVPDFRRIASRAVQQLEHGGADELRLATTVLERQGSPDLTPYLLKLVRQPLAPDEAVSYLLWRFGDASIHDAMIELLDDPRLRLRAFLPLVRCGTPDDHLRLLPHAQAYHAEIKRRGKARGESLAGLEALKVLRVLAERVWNPAFNEASLPLLKDGNMGATVARMIERTGDSSLIPALERLVDDPKAGRHARRLIEHFQTQHNEEEK